MRTHVPTGATIPARLAVTLISYPHSECEVETTCRRTQIVFGWVNSHAVVSMGGFIGRGGGGGGAGRLSSLPSSHCVQSSLGVSRQRAGIATKFLFCPFTLLKLLDLPLVSA